MIDDWWSMISDEDNDDDDYDGDGTVKKIHDRWLVILIIIAIITI